MVQENENLIPITRINPVIINQMVKAPYLYINMEDIQPIPTGVATDVIFDTEYSDVYGLWSALAPTDIVIPVSWGGVYLITAFARFTSEAAGGVRCMLLGETDSILCDAKISTIGVETILVASCLEPILDLGTIKLKVEQDSGVDLDLMIAQLQLRRIAPYPEDY